jgi:hypothetical protein
MELKIVVRRNEREPKITIDLKGVHYPYAIRDAIKLALEIEGFTEQKILEVFNQMPDVKCESNE